MLMAGIVRGDRAMWPLRNAGNWKRDDVALPGRGQLLASGLSELQKWSGAIGVLCGPWGLVRKTVGVERLPPVDVCAELGWSW